MNPKERELRRIRGVQMVLSGSGQREVARSLDVAPSAVHYWLGRYTKKGWDGLKTAEPHGPPVTFQAKQRRMLRRLVIQNPKNYGFSIDCWTVDMLRAVINDKFEKSYSTTTILRYLHKEGISFQKPKQVAYERDHIEETRWLSKELPKVLANAKKHGARVFFEDESGFQLEATSGKTWAPVGETPVVHRSGKRGKITVAGAVSNKGDLHLKRYRYGGMTGQRYAAFLESIKKSTAGQLWLSMMASQPTERKKSKKP
jgi:transposase